MSQHNYVFYGTSVASDELIGFVEHLVRSNLEAEAAGRRKTPICIWGRHGIGKTRIVEDTARAQGWRFAYVAPAQFEEMGDLVGMPAVEGDRTVWRAPEWVPAEEGPGVLLIDDVNRADDRILRGIMQLLQNYELVSWRLPAKWQIVLTANPDGGDYSVTPMDDAMLTRMMHVTLEFDVSAWARWAEANGVDPRGINFVLTYPEIVSGERTTPRTLVQFFESIQSITDLKAQLGLVRILADSCLDEPAVAAFITFVQQGLSQLISPEELLGAKDFGPAYARVRDAVEGETLRVDILATLCTRLVNHLSRRKERLTKPEIENLKRFLTMDLLPNDLRLTVAQELVRASDPGLKRVLADPTIARLLLSSKRGQR
ncbi:MAG: AAA family ATPase [Alphaproteobacteria bacterium]|nr:AAA family ATPase [Alphaproteobacteria bacterium]